MSEFFSGITFPEQKVTPSDDASIRREVLVDGILSGCEISYVGSTLTLGAGLMVACGRQFRHTAVQNFAVTGASSGYARLVLTIDTTRASTKDNFDQIDIAIEYATALDGFAPLRQDDINSAGTVYQMAVCVVSLGAGGISGIVTKLPSGVRRLYDFTPVQQGGGARQLPNKVRLGWTGTALALQVDDVDLGDLATTAEFTAVIPISAWGDYGSAKFCVIPVAGLGGSDSPIIDVLLTGTQESVDADLLLDAEWTKIYRVETTYEGFIAYARETPAVDLPVKIKVVR